MNYIAIFPFNDGSFIHYAHIQILVTYYDFRCGYRYAYGCERTIQ